MIFYILKKDESVGYSVKDFTISNYPLEQTEFLYDSKQGMVIYNKWRHNKKCPNRSQRNIQYNSYCILKHTWTLNIFWIE